jgi:transcriptional regulator with XRE-family HTH domain
MAQQGLVRAGVMSSGMISEIEGKRWRTNRPPTAPVLAKLATALGVTVADLTPDAILDHPMLDRAELDRREREFEEAERALAKTGRRPTLHLRAALRNAQSERKPRVDVVGLHPRETNECKRSARELPLSLRFMNYDEFQRALPSTNVVVFQKGVPHANFNVGALKAKGVTVRFANGGVSSVLEMLRAVVASENEVVAA